MKSDNKTIRAMQLVIPAMILCLIGDYCIGIEPGDSTTLGNGIASSGWLTIADWRIAVSNFCGMIGSILYAIGAVAFSKFLLEQKVKLERSIDKLWVNIYVTSLGLGCVSFMYFHIACGGLIQHFKVLYEVTGGDIQMAIDAWMKMIMPELLPMSLMFIGFDVLASLAWVVIIFRKILPVSKWWILAAPLVMAGIGTLLELIPLPFNGLNAGFETLGWMLMFICGIKYKSNLHRR